MAGKRTVIKVNGVSLDQIDDEVMLTDLVSVWADCLCSLRLFGKAQLSFVCSDGICEG
jgi:hypothetical protein